MTLPVLCSSPDPINMLKPPARAIVIERTWEILPAPSYSSTTLSTWATPQSSIGPPVMKLSRWEKLKMILSYGRPQYFPSVPTQRAFQKKVRALINCSSLEALKTLPAPSLEIPGQVSFDNMLNCGTCTPIRIEQFMAYLRAEMTAENLQFLFWYKDYVRRFNLLAAEDMILHPPWTNEDHERAVQSLASGRRARTYFRPSTNSVHHRDISPGSSHRLPTPPASAAESISRICNRTSSADPTPPSTANSELEPLRAFGQHLTVTPKRVSRCNSKIVPVQMAEKPLDIKLVAPWEEPPLSPCFKPRPKPNLLAKKNVPVTLDSLRADVQQTLATYLTQSSPRQLNLSSTERSLLTYSLTRTLHPSSFALAVSYVEHILRTESYPKFILSTFQNANPPRLTSALCSGVFLLLISAALQVLMFVRRWDRGLRALGVIPVFVGIVIIYAAANGMCVVLHYRGRYQRKPWDVDSDREELIAGSGGGLEEKGGGGVSWRQRYRRRWVVRRIFDREAMVQEQHILDGQRIIFGQAVWTGFLVCVPLLMVLLAV